MTSDGLVTCADLVWCACVSACSLGESGWAGAWTDGSGLLGGAAISDCVLLKESVAGNDGFNQPADLKVVVLKVCCERFNQGFVTEVQ